ncbi:Zn-ribbon domain-containing OB-fold protein [Mycolicibacterium thermoresistibile]|uniref:ChsH2 C-terminal OB-fold domain-containing protein n=2 Tax=Mycolicibacterium thermoresistibile TaxID=1797 RepID=G7CH36_MYCT3|nr:OB-fold domain-containing protein [Mycolicibacterium thermoresistibile]EHI12146.1 hypothetical protein KEK_14643 [Mycolicibacterium thermoresistibile ATCC 19527]MCV7191139.1 OB-fold domain-containing protein [Mycolicibacterium thermoresistibile]GAT15513.1 putative uncharacterized protein [Mycolicibacterium thermoresistibile]SNW16936.1 putative nucleic-acid-binding protein containing a Zn-ribbon [Mycolicibacterium thermoresistibile]
MTRPVPYTDDHETGPFFAAAREGALALCFCSRCDQVLHLPRAHCRFCGSWRTDWREVSGRGSVYSWTVVERQLHPAFPVPYTLVLVSVHEYPEVRLLGHLPGRPALRAGMPMVAIVERVDDTAVLNWAPQE